MDNTLKRIIETDRISREKVGERKMRLASIDTEIAGIKSDLDDELLSQSKKNIAKATETAEIKLKQEIDRIDEFYSEAEKSLRTSFESNKDDLADKIFKKVIE